MMRFLASLSACGSGNPCGNHARNPLLHAAWIRPYGHIPKAYTPKHVRQRPTEKVGTSSRQTPTFLRICWYVEEMETEEWNSEVCHVSPPMMTL
mmetsp:Transcript_65093/g.125697  ORF Transcript_65093/g.125697 Transcript_65093/m.125697 type:complete len:94 (+) Transcript_65093:222-503(+)